jgi:predicted permease
MNNLIQDVKYALRMLGRTPWFTAVAVASLALGIGANTAIFSLTDQILLRMLPVENPQELVVLRSDGPFRGGVSSDGDDAQSFSYPLYQDLRDRNQVFSGLLARYGTALSVSGQGRTERARGELVSGNYFQVLGVPAALGRMITPQDDAESAGAAVVLSHAYWTRQFGADPGILNQQLTVNGISMTVVGVARPGFTGVQVGSPTDAFIPMARKKQMPLSWGALDNRKQRWANLIARLKPGMTLEQAQAGLERVYQPLMELEVSQAGPLRPDSKQRWLNKKVQLIPGASGRNVLQNDAQAPLLILTILVALVLLIACANVANLLLARGASREREVAVRLAIGASRWQLVRQLLTESVLLALAGGVAALLVAWWTIGALLGTMPEGAGVTGLSPNLDGRLLLFTLTLSLATGIIFGLLPALRATRPNLIPALKDQAGASSGSGHVRFRKGLVVTQVALTALLLIGAGLFVRSLSNLKSVELGLKAEKVLTFTVAPALNGYKPDRSIALFDRVREDVAALPGVSSVSGSEIMAFEGSNSTSNATIEGYQAREDENVQVWQNTVGPDYFQTLGIPLLLGREFTAGDGPAAPKVAVINEHFAKKYFAGRNPVGMHFGWGSGNTVKTDILIVGVARDHKHASLREQPHPYAYQPYMQNPEAGWLTFYVRTKGEPGALAPAIRNAVRERDASLPVTSLKTLETQISEQIFAERLMGSLTVAFGGLAALLAAIGLYGVMAFTVARRTREIGIRIALGASRGSVQWMVLREVARMAGLGLVIGVPAALGLGRYAETILFGVKANDAAMIAAAIGLLAVVTGLAGYVPARLAARIEPVVALRYE